MSRRFIPDGRPNIGRFIPKDEEERDYTSEFQSLTDIFEPKDQYNRNIFKVVTGDSVLDEHVQRLRRMLEAKGEYVLFIKRILDGTPCSCYDPVSHEIRRHNCLQCYGTRVKGGYQLFKDSSREDGKLIVSAPFAEQSIDWEEYSREQTEELSFWTLPWIPMVAGTTMKSYDWIIRYNADGTELGRFYVTNVKPARNVNNRVTYQHFTVSKADQPTYDLSGNTTTVGDIIYSIDITKLSVIVGKSDDKQGRQIVDPNV